jgi:hypothetical protein
MDMIIPNGLASEAVVQKARFCVQTEFAHRPKPRVTTTISLNGEVVEKVETKWQKSPLTEEDKQDIERFLQEQHQKVMEKIKAKEAQPESDEVNQEDGRPVSEDAVLKVDQELSRTHGVSGWTFMLKDGRILSHRISHPQDRERFEQIRDLASLLATVTPLGKLTGGVLELPVNLSVVLPVGEHFLGVRLHPQVDPKSVVDRIRELA